MGTKRSYRVVSLLKITALLLVFSFAKGQNITELNLFIQKTDSTHTKELKALYPKRGYALSYNPVRFLGNTFLWVYQRIFSEQVMADCGFEPSCSSFAKQAIQERGVFLGVFLTADRLTRCNGTAQLESEIYLVNKKTGKLRDEPQMYKFRK